MDFSLKKKFQNLSIYLSTFLSLKIFRRKENKDNKMIKKKKNRTKKDKKKIYFLRKKEEFSRF